MGFCRTLTVIVSISVVLAACAPEAAPTGPAQFATTPPRDAISAPSGTAPAPTPVELTNTPPAATPTERADLSAGQARAVAAASADLAARVGVPLDEVELVRLIADDLPSQDLGCPGAGTKSSVQPAFVSGWIIYLSVAEQEYEYRAHASQVVFCGERAAGAE